MVKKSNELICVERGRCTVGSSNLERTASLLVLAVSELRVQASQSTFEVETAKNHQPISVVDAPSLRCQRKVRFSEREEIFVIGNRKDISSKEKRKIWYRKSELRASYEQQEADGQHNTDIGATDDFGAWGSHLVVTPRDGVYECQRAFHRLIAVSAVLDEQERQKMNGIQNSDLVSETYIESVSRSRQALFIAGLLSQEKIRKYQRRLKRETPPERVPKSFGN
jgi:hypothetical protein